MSSLDTYFYVDQKSGNVSPDGTKQNPFTDLEQAVNNIQIEDSEIILLGDEITLSTNITFSKNLSYTIK